MTLRYKCVTVLAHGLRTAANAIFALVRRCMWRKTRPTDAARVCIYRIGNIGDIVCALPAMAAIRRAYPNARLTLVSSPGRAGALGAEELLRGAPWLQELVVYYAEDIRTWSGAFRLIRTLRAQAFDVWIELPPVQVKFTTELRNILAARAAGAGWAHGWRLDTIRFAARAESELHELPDEVTRLMRLVETVGIPAGSAEFDLPRSEAHRSAVDALFRQHNLRDRELVALAPGSKAAPNHWPAESFAEVGRHLVNAGLKVVVVGGESDVPLCSHIADGIGTNAIDLSGKTSLLESCELLSRCRLLICVDSGVQHLASAVATPCLALFSCRDVKGRWRPFGARNTMVRKWVECHTCLLDVCPFDNRCMKLIEASEVIAEATRKLNGDFSPPLDQSMPDPQPLPDLSLA